MFDWFDGNAENGWKGNEGKSFAACDDGQIANKYRGTEKYNTKAKALKNIEYQVEKKLKKG